MKRRLYGYRESCEVNREPWNPENLKLEAAQRLQALRPKILKPKNPERPTPEEQQLLVKSIQEKILNHKEKRSQTQHIKFEAARYFLWVLHPATP